MNKLDRLEARLDRLERHNSLLRIIIIALGGASIVACTMLEATPTIVSPSVVETKALHILDDNGGVIAELGRDGLLVRDDQGRPRLSLRHTDEDSGLYIMDEAGDSRVGVIHFAHGGSGVALHGPKVRGAAVLYYKQTGSLAFYDADGNVIDRVPAR